VASTAWALQTQTAQAVPSPTATPLPSPTLEATNTPTITPSPSSTPTATKYVVPATPTAGGPIPSMFVTLTANDKYTDTAEVPTGKVLIFRAEVQNTNNIPLQVVANLTVPDGWVVVENMFNDCPITADLRLNKKCTISWKFRPNGTGQVILRVYVRGLYTDAAGTSQRITRSPAFFFTVY
jgi:hypothetical protein